MFEYGKRKTSPTLITIMLIGNENITVFQPPARQRAFEMSEIVA